MKLAVVTLILLGCLAAGAAVVVVNLFIETNAEQEVEVLVAAEDLAPLSKIDASHVKQVSVAKAAVLQERGYLVDAVQAIGRVLSRRISRGQLVTASCFLSDEGDERFSMEIPEGMRAFTVSLPSSSVMSGLLYPHCRVDIYGVFDLKNDNEGDALGIEILQGVEVLAVEYKTVVPEGGANEESRSGRSNSVRVTFALTPDQLKALQLSLKEGDITLALRNPRDRGIRRPDPTFITQGMFHGATPQISPPSDSNQTGASPDPIAENFDDTSGSVIVIRGDKVTVEPFREVRDRSQAGDEPQGRRLAGVQPLAPR